MEFATGIAENILGRLASYAAQEVRLAWGAQLELKKLNKTLKAITAVLEDAEKKQTHNSKISHWLGNLKDVCNDAEDVLDHFDFHKLQQQVFINKSRSSRVKAKVHQIFSRWNPVVFNFKMGHKLKGIRERLDEINKEKNEFSLDGIAETSHVLRKCHESESLLDPSSVIGREEDKEKIIKYLSSDTNHSSNENMSVISIVGFGGLGKTELARLVYNDHVVEETFDMKMWLRVSNNFDIQRVVEHIIVAATLQKCDYPNFSLMRKGLRRILKDKKFLLVLDDVWDTKPIGITPESWNDLKTLLNRGASGSKVMVTTRNQSVALLMNSIHHNLKGLDDESGMYLLMKMAGVKSYPAGLTEIGKEIVKKCGGVPRAIKTLARMLQPTRKLHDWIRVRDDHMWSSEGNDMTMEALMMSYDAMPSHLKLCFAFFSLFPKGYEFTSLSIVSLWMAQGYIAFSKGDRDFQEIGLEYIRELFSRSLIQVETNSETLLKFRINNLVHDLAIWVARLNCSTFHFRPPTSENIWHVSISTEDLCEDEKLVPEFMLLSHKLRTILFPDEKGGITSKSFLEKCITRFRYMRVLDLSGSTLEEIPSSIGKLIHLRYLSMSNNKMIKRLPNSICRLLILQSLDFGGCEALEELPRDMGNLINLRYLVISTQQMYLRKGTFRGLRLLQSLGLVDCINLKSLGEETKELSKLHTLFIKDCKKLDLSSGQGIQALQSFTINNSDLEALPDWLQECVGSLRNIVMENCDDLKTLPDWLGDIRWLRGLVIRNCPKLSAWPEGIFYRLDLGKLEIRGCPKLSRECKRQFKDDEWDRFMRTREVNVDFEDEENDEDEGEDAIRSSCR